jgi:peptide-methionine (S)-S-oxide reductase
MRHKYRSAIYVYDGSQFERAADILNGLRAEFHEPLITQAYPLKGFKKNKIELIDYFYSAPNRPFCQTYIQPKIKLLLALFNRHVNQGKMTGALNSVRENT